MIFWAIYKIYTQRTVRFSKAITWTRSRLGKWLSAWARRLLTTTLCAKFSEQVALNNDKCVCVSHEPLDELLCCVCSQWNETVKRQNKFHKVSFKDTLVGMRCEAMRTLLKIEINEVITWPAIVWRLSLLLSSSFEKLNYFSSFLIAETCSIYVFLDKSEIHRDMMSIVQFMLVKQKKGGQYNEGKYWRERAQITASRQN